jgi:hypothetical protein
LIKYLEVDKATILFERDTMLGAEQRKKRKKKQQMSVLENEQVESELVPELLKALEDAAMEKKYLDVQICPKCKSPLIWRVDSVGDMWAHIGITPQNYHFSECGWRQKIVLKATNRPTTFKDVA